MILIIHSYLFSLISHLVGRACGWDHIDQWPRSWHKKLFYDSKNSLLPLSREWYVSPQQRAETLFENGARKEFLERPWTSKLQLSFLIFLWRKIADADFYAKRDPILSQVLAESFFSHRRLLLYHSTEYSTGCHSDHKYTRLLSQEKEGVPAWAKKSLSPRRKNLWSMKKNNNQMTYFSKPENRKPIPNIPYSPLKD